MKIFVSSTTNDLADARERVCKQLLQLDIQPVSMDWYASDPKAPQKLDDERVKSCDAFVIIVGHLYGSSLEGQEKSFTELEYETAVASGKDVFAFLASNKFLLPPDLQEDDATRQKLRAFRERLEKDHTPRYFDNEDHLCAEVAAAVPKPREQAGRISVPKLPHPYLAHPYPIQENFTGRVKERTMLTEWVTAADSRPLLSLVGMGGIGKSALTWFWLHEDLPQEDIRFSGVIWWSFYEREASFESFLAHALLYASGGTTDPTQVASDYDRMQDLWRILRDSPLLIVFDGAERLLRAYHALDAAYRGDDFKEETGDNHLRCADPRAGQFLQWLASPGTKTRTLVTTRLHPKELEGLAGCQREELKRLDPHDAVEFMRRQGVEGPRNDIVHACKPYDFLPLCVRLLAGAISEDPEHPGDIVLASDWRPPATLTEHRHHILQVAYDTMAKDRRDLLSRIAAMRGPVDYATAKVLSTYNDEGDLREALRELVARGLLFRREGQAYYDLHPIVRQYAYDRLGDRAATHEALKDYFDTIPRPDKIEGLDDLMPTIELFHHTIAAGGYEQAYAIFKTWLSRPLYYQLGAYDTEVSLLEAFFPNDNDKAPWLDDEHHQAWVLNGLAIAYSRTGKDREAVGLQQRANSIAEKIGRTDSLAIGLCNLAQAQWRLGDLEEALVNLRRHVDIANGASDEGTRAYGLAVRGLILAYLGQYHDADGQMKLGLSLFTRTSDEHYKSVTWSHRACRAMLMEAPRSALEATEEAKKCWELSARKQQPSEPNLVEILWLSGAAKRLAADVSGCDPDLNEALSRCRRIRLVEFEADILLEMAKLQWQKAQGKDAELIEESKSLTREALEIADRCEYRLKQADIHDFLAQMALADGDKASAREHAEIAKERAWCDGPPHCYRKALDDAEQMLAKLQ
jgi:tetratricopeptide (TPR) repeat protein